ncbi:MAG: hypothetical protein HQK49_11870 [Oligoflexia bacterium]|nr:hypothetical protein [Oligoflexia bacterium]
MVKKVRLINCKIVKATQPIVTRYGIYPGPGTIVTRYAITRPTTITTNDNQKVDIECESMQMSSHEDESVTND